MLYVTFITYIYVEICKGGIYKESGPDKQLFGLEEIPVDYFFIYTLVFV